MLGEEESVSFKKVKPYSIARPCIQEHVSSTNWTLLVRKEKKKKKTQILMDREREGGSERRQI